MKYMSFNSSCTYAGLANMLKKRGIDVEDYEIALEMKLPFFIEKNEDGFSAGPLLQSKKWFDLYLNPYGLELLEVWVDKAEMFEFLKTKEEAMLGIKMQNGRNAYHAVVYTGMKAGKAVFLNNKHEGSKEPDGFEFTEDELIALLRDKTRVGTLNTCIKKEADLRPLLEQSIQNLTDLQSEFDDFCSGTWTNAEILEKEEGLFRPILLDGPSMMKLLRQNELYEDMRTLQKVFVDIAFKKKADNILLAERFDMDLLHSICERWRILIGRELKIISGGMN